MDNYAPVDILLNDDDDEEEEEEEEEELLAVDFKWEHMLNHRGHKEHVSGCFGLQRAVENTKDIV
jgi:hypothetical protein